MADGLYVRADDLSNNNESLCTLIHGACARAPPSVVAACCCDVVRRQGEVRDGRPEGQGRIQCANGDWQEGLYVNGSPAGTMRVRACHSGFAHVVPL